jgi:hypothetical protein
LAVIAPAAEDSWNALHMKANALHAQGDRAAAEAA